MPQLIGSPLIIEYVFVSPKLNQKKGNTPVVNREKETPHVLIILLHFVYN